MNSWPKYKQAAFVAGLGYFLMLAGMGIGLDWLIVGGWGIVAVIFTGLTWWLGD